MTAKRRTYNITEDRQIRLERLAIDISQKIDKQVRWTELLTYLIDQYGKDAADDLVSAYSNKKTKNNEIDAHQKNRQSASS